MCDTMHGAAREDEFATFPVTTEFEESSGFAENKTYSGMSLRDYFAAAALQGFLAAPDSIGTDARNHSFRVAAWAYEVADAMLHERKAP